LQSVTEEIQLYLVCVRSIEPFKETKKKQRLEKGKHEEGKKDILKLKNATKYTGFCWPTVRPFLTELQPTNKDPLFSLALFLI
jgi:hypothetical protein